MVAAGNRSDRIPIELQRFAARFDRQEYWLAHEELEALWLRDRRDGYKGLIHLAAALLHAERGNTHGTAVKLESARQNLVADPLADLGLDAEGLCAAVRDFLAADTGATDAPVAGVQAGAGDQPRVGDWLADGTAAAIEDVELPYRVSRHDHGYRPGRRSGRRD